MTIKVTIYSGLVLFSLLLSCGQKSTQKKKFIGSTVNRNPTEQTKKPNGIINPEGQILMTRIKTPIGFERVNTKDNSFAAFLRHLPLKPYGAEVMLHNGSIKPNGDVYEAVVDLEIGTKDLHQCADAVMRLRAEYLWKQNLFDKIHFNFTNGFRVDYTEWMKGKRVIVKGNKAFWSQAGTPSNTYKDFWKYMEIIFSYAGTLSLSKELKTVIINDLKAGDVFIQGGSPGHAIIVVDLAVNPNTHEKIFLLAQSYMPAQEIQLLKNPNNDKISPWYSLNFGKRLKTPEWIFNKNDLKRFAD